MCRECLTRDSPASEREMRAQSGRVVKELPLHSLEEPQPIQASSSVPMLGTRQLRGTCRLALAGAAARVRRDLSVVAAAGASSALGPGPNCIGTNRPDRALGRARGANRDGGSWLVLIARAPIRRRKCRLRGLVVEVTRRRELDWAALGICRRGAEAYRL